jgi:acetyl-CoA acetyltransferase
MPDLSKLVELRGKTALVSAGSSPFTLKSTQSNEGLLASAVKASLDGLPLDKRDIDGLIVSMGYPLGVNYDRVSESLGLDVPFVYESWAHGRFANPAIQLGSMAIANGFASNVLLVAVGAWVKPRERRPAAGGGGGENARAAGGPHGEVPYAGLNSAMGGAAMSMAKYFARYGGSSEELGAIAVAQRKHARLNPNAVMQKEMSLEDYLDAPYIIEPLRRNDCSLVSEGAVSILMTSAERARDLTEKPVYVVGAQGMHSSRNEHSFGLPGQGIFTMDEYEYEADLTAFEMAGLNHDDIDTLGIYDAFSVQTLVTIERMGFCKPGEGLSFIQGGRIELGGALPLNTSGGHLSEAHVGGWGQVAELVHQLQGTCGPRQVEGAETGMYAHSLGDATIFATKVA